MEKAINEDMESTFRVLKGLLTLNKTPVTNPTATLIGGQPGAGKTTLTEVIMEENKNTISIDGDMIRMFHPDLEEIQILYKDEYPVYTQEFVNEMIERLIDALSDEKYNLIIEGTLRDISVPLRTTDKLMKKGYKTRLLVLAVSREKSWKNTIDRGNALREMGLVPRYVKKEHHDKVADSIPHTVSRLTQLNDFDNILIMNRNKELLYDRSLTPDKDVFKLMDSIINGRN